MRKYWICSPGVGTFLHGNSRFARTKSSFTYEKGMGEISCPFHFFLFQFCPISVYAIVEVKSQSRFQGRMGYYICQLLLA